MFAPDADFLPRLGDRVVLRRLSNADLEIFQAYRSDLDLGRFQSWSAMSLTEAAVFLSEMSIADFGVVGEWFQLGIADRFSGHLLGDIGVCLRHTDDAYAEIGFTLATKLHGQGLGAEAVREVLAMLFERTRVARIIAITDTRNLASVRLLERVGMSLTKTVSTVIRGEPCDEHLFIIHRRGACSRPATNPCIERTATGQP